MTRDGGGSGGGGGEVVVEIPPGDPAALHRLADALDKHATAVLNLGQDTGSKTADVRTRANWSGAAADAYTGFTGAASGGISALHPHLTAMAASVRTYADTLDGAQKRVQTAIDTANTASKNGAPDAQTQIDAAKKASSDAKTEVDGAGDKAGAEVEEEKHGLEKFLEVIEPYRKANEWIHVPVDVATEPLTEAILKALGTGKEAARDQLKDLSKELHQLYDDQVQSVARDFDHGDASMDDVEDAFAKYFVDSKGIDDGIGDAAKSLRGWEMGSKVLGVTAILGDAATIVDPEDKGTMGWVDRGAAGVNMGAIGTDLLAANYLDEVPIVGEVVMVADVATGVYLAGDFLYHHFKPFHDVANTVGHGVASAAEATAHGVSSAAHSVAHFFGW
ncbi:MULTISPECIES: WXG100 family type VII secretion target [Streptacidiphilus]|uniref:WXG100 family type VII secretion target n=1 Tax=Streptacidiphilus cavernicola TaxID=3342716 RepID=A0ABV6UVI3_9ACTN|nr:hypothetical protein [Streptacidiphilus jeojiense]